MIRSAFGTYLLAAVYGTIPEELVQATTLDGASRRQNLARVVIFQRTLTRGITAGAVK